MALFKSYYYSLGPMIELMSTDWTYFFALNSVILFFLIESKASSIASSAFLLKESSTGASSAVSFKKLSKSEVWYCWPELFLLDDFLILM